MGVNNAELYNNIGLCCFYAQQYDMTFNCFMRALAIATDDSLADVWYNIGHVALVSTAAMHLFTVLYTYMNGGSAESLTKVNKQRLEAFEVWIQIVHGPDPENFVIGTI